jgi:hypothetical protein
LLFLGVVLGLGLGLGLGLRLLLWLYSLRPMCNINIMCRVSVRIKGRFLLGLFLVFCSRLGLG